MALEGIEACVFDAYGTLFDFNSAAARCGDVLGDRLDAVNDAWRQKQLQYTWLRTLMGVHANFWQVTGEALDFALAANGFDDPALHARLMALYRELDPYPEVADVLGALKAAGCKTAILSNGAPEMLQAAVDSAGLGDLLNAVLSVEAVGVYKPDPRVYQLAPEALGVGPHEICFQSSNAWDAVGAAQFGFRVAWVNRAGQPRERLPAQPDAELRTLAELPPLLGFAG